jgi:hypothetical protein
VTEQEIVTVWGVLNVPPPLIVGVATVSVNTAVATLLSARPVFQALAFSVRLWPTVTVPPDATTVSLVVGSAPFVVYRIVAPGVTSVTVTVRVEV